jgi:hypothetical protein
VSGKTLGGASIATVQGTIVLALAPAIGVRLTWLVVLEVIGLELLMAVTMTAFGVFVASHIRRMEGFSVVMQPARLTQSRPSLGRHQHPIGATLAFACRSPRAPPSPPPGHGAPRRSPPGPDPGAGQRRDGSKRRNPEQLAHGQDAQ